MNIEQSKRYISYHYGWVVDESTSQILSEEQCLWVAYVTTNQKERGEEEKRFPIIVQMMQVFTALNNGNLQALGEWCLQQSRGEI